jgi:hypothetical protein
LARWANLAAFWQQIVPIVPFLPVMPVSNYCTVYNLRSNAHHGMEEVVGSIPTRSTNQINNLDRTFWEQYLVCGNSMGTLHFCPLVGSVPRFPVQQDIDRTALRGTLFLHARLRIDLHRRADFGVPHEFLPQSLAYWHR